MTEPPRLAERIEHLRERVEDDPEAVSIDEVIDVLEPADVSERRRLVSILDRKLAAEPSIAPDLIETLDGLFEHENSDVRTVAATILEHLAGRYPEEAAPAVEHLIPLLHDDYPFARRHAVWALAHVAEARPDRVAPHVPDLRPAEDESAYFEEEHVITLLRNVAARDVEAIVPLVPALLEALESTATDSEPASEGVYTPGIDEQFNADQFKDSIDVALTAGELVAAIADETPQGLEPHVDDLLDAFETLGRRTVRREITTALAAYADFDPEAIVPGVPALASALGSRDVPLQSHAARTLGLVAAAEPATVADAVAPKIDELAPLLRDGTPAVQASVAGLLSYVAEEDPAAVAPVIDDLITALETEDDVVRASTAIALGFAGGDDAKGALVALSKEDLDLGIDEAVRDAIERIESSD